MSSFMGIGWAVEGIGAGLATDGLVCRRCVAGCRGLAIEPFFFMAPMPQQPGFPLPFPDMEGVPIPFCMGAAPTPGIMS